KTKPKKNLERECFPLLFTGDFTPPGGLFFPGNRTLLKSWRGGAIQLTNLFVLVKFSLVSVRVGVSLFILCVRYRQYRHFKLMK
ncbi:MAG: hypothetical protein ACOYJB_10145, partial [Christensenellaceae bacterium]